MTGRLRSRVVAGVLLLLAVYGLGGVAAVVLAHVLAYFWEQFS